jgi:hypothetical protein
MGVCSFGGAPSRDGGSLSCKSVFVGLNLSVQRSRIPDVDAVNGALSVPMNSMMHRRSSSADFVFFRSICVDFQLEADKRFMKPR